MTRKDPQAPTTRDRILHASIALVQEGKERRLSVRAVAARAGVGMGTLRYHFPTQRELLDAVFSSLYEEALPDGRIRDATVPADERLLECCRHMLNPIDVGDRARDVWSDLYHAFIAPGAAADHRAGYVELRRQALRRVQSWLSVLVEEGALSRGDNIARSQFLLTVLDGLALQRALPSESALLDLETAVLKAAIASLSTIR
ncbi:TetR/AcrR family transcriptional regulator [Pararoseomonas sp. SCSIO 73927]|uniref:TetR/AcrR family transcriptional regulator n=1 Tax=Pararoseomonas sp. SCSIO 73927 TaxID=3114537 RepID=UPI0030CDBE57